MSKANKFSVDELLKIKSEPIINTIERNDEVVDLPIHNYNLMQIYYQKLMENQLKQVPHIGNNYINILI